MPRVIFSENSLCKSIGAAHAVSTFSMARCNSPIDSALVFPHSFVMVSASSSRCCSNKAFNRYKRSEEHTSELQSLMRISYAVVCLKKKKKTYHHTQSHVLI